MRFLCLVLLVAGVANAQPDYGFNFVTIGAPGNRGTLPEETPDNPFQSIGAVNYEYRIATEKLSNAQYLEFANTYGQYVHTLQAARDVAGYWLTPVPQDDGSYRFEVEDNRLNIGAGMSWEMAARYCNWLSNNKGTTQASFENGAYDTSTFINTLPYPAQLQHNPDARFWIPSLDELVKADYYDPNKFGQGQGGFNYYPNSSDTPLVEGLPGTGAETIGNLLWQNNPNAGPLREFPLGQYPETQSPWWLLDVSGTLQDWTASSDQASHAFVRVVGSVAGVDYWSAQDRLGLPWDDTPFQSFGNALRLASVVPSPAPVSVLVCFLIKAMGNRRRFE